MPEDFTKFKVFDSLPKVPWRVTRQRMSDCCHAMCVLVRSSEGGFVRWYCSECGKHDTLTANEFFQLNLEMACPQCGRPMVPCGKLRYSNYGFVCVKCRIAIKLGDLLPSYEDL